VPDLAAFALLVALAGFNAWHHWLLLARQHKQIRELERLLALREESPMVGAFLSRDQDLEARRNQPAHPENSVKIRPVS